MEALQAKEIFAQLKQKSNCPFAQKAKVDVFAWNEKIDFIDNLELLSIQLKKITLNNSSHGLAVVMPAHYGNTIELLAKNTKNILNYLQHKENILESNFETKDYQFTFANTRFFILTLSPVYPSTHSRYIFDLPATIIFFQLESSFVKKGISKTEKNMTIRNNIRNLFRKAERSYDHFLIMHQHEISESIDSYKYVKPYHANDAPIRFWEYDNPKFI